RVVDGIMARDPDAARQAAIDLLK
ncbi:GntR family transcriptional regulator, partial [Photobacterium aphoticum]